MAVSYVEQYKKKADKKGKTHGQKEVVRLEVFNAILEGYTYRNLMYALQHDDFNIGRKYTKRSSACIISEVYQEIRDSFKEQKDTLAYQQFERLINLYNEAKEYDKGSALNALKEINKLCGLYEPKKIDMNVSGELEVNFELNNESQD